jgi:hypothetical protein
VAINRIAQTTVKIMPPELCIDCNTVEVVKYLMGTQLGWGNLYTICDGLLSDAFWFILCLDFWIITFEFMVKQMPRDRLIDEVVHKIKKEQQILALLLYM